MFKSWINCLNFWFECTSSCSDTISSHSSLGSRQQESEELLGVIGLRHGLTQAVDKDCSPAVGLQHRTEQPLKEAEELLVLCRYAHLFVTTTQSPDKSERLWKLGVVRKSYFQVAISLLLSKVTVLVFFVTSPGKRLRELFGPKLIWWAGIQFLLVLLTNKNKSELDQLWPEIIPLYCLLAVIDKNTSQDTQHYFYQNSLCQSAEFMVMVIGDG